MDYLNHLLEPITVGRMYLRNRLLMEPLGRLGYAVDDEISDRFIAFYAERAKGGVGLIVIRIMPLTDLGRPGPSGPGLYDDKFIVGLRRLTDAIHAHGSKVAAQIGVDHTWSRGKGYPAEYVGPSSVAFPNRYEPLPTPRELTVEEIRMIVDQFGDGARRAQEAGFDAIEIHAFGSYLLAKFLCPRTNRRSDEYGGSRQARLRIVLDVIDNIKRKAGTDCTLACRLAGEDFVEGGHTLEDTKVYATLLEKAGIQLLDVGHGSPGSDVPSIQAVFPRGSAVYLAEAVRKMVKIPVVASCRINDPLLAERIVAEKRADVVGVARALIADPEFLSKARDRRFGEICPCIACCHCYDTILEHQPMACSVNPRAGRELECAVTPSAVRKKVVVVGGGPAGMQAATLAAQRGHEVKLFEKASKLGGQLLPAAAPPHKEEIGGLTRYLSDQVDRSRVDVKLNAEINAPSIQALKPDVVIIAAGARAVLPGISGIHRCDTADALDVLLKLDRRTSERVIVVGGGLIGCEVAEFLAEQGREVTITTRQEDIGYSIGRTNRWLAVERLKKKGVRIETGVTPTEVTSRGVAATQAGSTKVFAADTVLFAGGMESNRELVEPLSTRGFAVYVIGDCMKPQGIAEAIGSGFRVASQI